MGYDGDGGTPAAPLIDQVHRLMHLWRAGDVVRVDEYLDARGLRRNALFHQLLQALIELAPAGSEERSLLESISNHIAARPASAEDRQRDMFRSKTRRSWMAKRIGRTEVRRLHGDQAVCFGRRKLTWP